jgi:SpoVK/Ycf46/Vps4 family AAA+-type ATPase
MEYSNTQIQALLEAIKISPGNFPLQKMLGELLFQEGAYEAAETHLKQALGLAADNVETKLLLARTFFELGKKSASSVVVEELIQKGIKNAHLFILDSKLHFENGDFKSAKLRYDEALALDINLKDVHYEVALGEQIRKNNLAVSEYAENDFEEQGDFADIIEKPKVKFQDVGGLKQVKDEIALKVIHPLKNPEIYKAYGKKIGGGILMYGPPGCGKTFLARATAGEIEANFISVGINDVLDMWLGNSEKNLHEIFQTARLNTPCVLFFDEVDALGASRSDMRKSSSRTMINQFLDELDGLKYSNEGILILAATNCPWYLDSAFRRPGRFDRVIFVQPPDMEARSEILKLQLKDKPADNIDTVAVAKIAEEYSGADLKAVVDIAIELKLPESLKQNKVIPITTNDLKQALKQHKSSTKEWFSTAKNYALYSNEAGLYDPILSYLKMKK